MAPKRWQSLWRDGRGGEMGPQRWQSLCVTRRPLRANQVQRGQDVPALPGVLRPRGRREPRAQLRAGAVARARARRATRMPNAPSWHCLSWHCPSWHCLSPPRASHAPGRTPPRVASPPLGLGRCAHSAAEGLACPDTSRSLRPPRPKRAHADGVSRLYRTGGAALRGPPATPHTGRRQLLEALLAVGPALLHLVCCRERGQAALDGRYIVPCLVRTPAGTAAPPGGQSPVVGNARSCMARLGYLFAGEMRP